MKKTKDSIFNEIYNGIIEANESQIGEFKFLVPDKKSWPIFDLGIRALAYDGAFFMQARSDYKEAEIEKESVSDSAGSEGIIDYESSFRLDQYQQQRHEQIKQLVIDAELERTKQPYTPSWNHDDEEDDSGEALSLFDAFKKEILPRYEKRRRAFAINLLRQLNIGKEKSKHAQAIAFNEIIKLSNIKLRGDSIVLRAKCIQFLEDYIEYYFPTLLNDLELDRYVKRLVDIRKRSDKNGFNTVCNRCGKPLYKKSGMRFCTKNEKRMCYEARLKENKKSPWPAVILKTKNLCHECKRYSSLNHIHKHKKDLPRQFCSKRCYERFRKKKQHRLKHATETLSLSMSMTKPV